MVKMMPDSRVARMDKERKEWLGIANFSVWRVLKLVEGGKGHVREIAGVFRGSNTTLERTVNNLIQWGFLFENRSKEWPFRRTLSLTKRGIKILNLLDKIGEMVKETRKATRRGRDKC